MATSVVEICNLALGRIAVSRSISATTEPTDQARACNRFYEQCRDEVLEGFPWPFASTTVALAVVETAPSDEWGYSYRMPSDAIAARYLVTGLRRDPVPPPFAVSSDDDGLLILTDESPATLVYTRRVVDPSLFSSSFASAVAWKLASEIAAPLSISLALSQRAEERFLLAVSRGQANALNGQVPDDEADAEATRSRQ